MSNNNFYEEKLKEIKKLISHDLLKAKELLDEELKMPYIPMKYEKEFQELEYQIYQALDKDFKNNSLSSEQAIKYLLSNDDINIALAIQFFQKANIRQYLDPIKSFLENKNNSSAAQALLFEILIEQNINKIFNINDTKLNPSKITSIIAPKDFNNAIQLFEKEFHKEPQLIDVSIKEFMQYILDHFPQSMKYDIVKLSTNFINVVKYMIYGNFELNKNEKKLLLEIQETKDK